MCNTCGCKEAEEFGAETFDETYRMKGATKSLISDVLRKHGYDDFNELESENLKFLLYDVYITGMEVGMESASYNAEEFGAEALVIPDGDSVPHHILYRLDREGIKYRFIEGDYGAEEFGAESKNCPKCDSTNLGKEEMPYCYNCGNWFDGVNGGCSKCDSENVGEEEMDYCYNCGSFGHWYDFGAESFEAREDLICDYCEKIISPDEGSVNWPDSGLTVCDDCFDDAIKNAEEFKATKGMDTYAQPLEELKIKPTKTKVGILLASIVAGGLWYSNKMKE